MIPALYDRRMSAVDSVIAQAVLIMVIDDSAGLQVGVYRDRTDVYSPPVSSRAAGYSVVKVQRRKYVSSFH